MLARRTDPKLLSRLSTRALAMLGLCLWAAPAFGATPAEEVTVQAAAPPDYDDPANWSAGPGGPGPAGVLPKGATPAASDAPVEVFYAHPTTFRAIGKWNQDPADPQSNRWTDESVVTRQASVFSACCNIWSPRYRAASSSALKDEAHRLPAFALAYTDIERAFDWFLVHVSRGRPFIIAGHSQGAKHIADLLEKRIDGTDLEQRMVAAYIIGINISEADFGGRFKHVPICDRPDQTGCALQWNAVEPSLIAKPEDAPDRRTLCINPVTFDRSRPYSLSAQAKGAVAGDPGYGPMESLRPASVAVRCENGLAVSYLAPGLGLKALPGGVLHYHDIGLFYADVRANAVLRTQAWLRHHQAAAGSHP